VASLGLAVNLFVVWWLHRGEEEKTLNEQGALWHVLGDLGASVAAVTAGAAILLMGWVWMDPALSLVIALVIAFGGVRVMRRSGHILIEGTPEGVSIEAVRGAMLARPQVRSVHDLHVWTLNGRDLYLSAHVDMDSGERSERQVMTDLHESLGHDFRVDHITLQMGHCGEGGCANDCEPWTRAPSDKPQDVRKD
jgi:cobalt-zinc-cadmium efflux system protein